jgi:hypothetical protein
MTAPLDETGGSASSGRDGRGCDCRAAGHARGRTAPSRLSRLLSGWRGALVMYLVFAGAFLRASGGRLREHSQYNLC